MPSRAIIGAMVAALTALAVPGGTDAGGIYDLFGFPGSVSTHVMIGQPHRLWDGDDRGNVGYRTFCAWKRIRVKRQEDWKRITVRDCHHVPS